MVCLCAGFYCSVLRGTLRKGDGHPARPPPLSRAPFPGRAAPAPWAPHQRAHPSRPFPAIGFLLSLTVAAQGAGVAAGLAGLSIIGAEVRVCGDREPVGRSALRCACRG
jgi:hypothetical protein